MSNRIFQYSLLASIIVHLIFLVAFSIVKIKSAPKSLKQIEVTYQNIKQKQVKKKETVAKDLKPIERVEPQPKKIELLDKIDQQPTFFEKKLGDIAKFSDRVKMNKKLTPNINPVDVHRTIKIPMLKSEKISNPKYLSYNQSVRQKIRERAYAHVDHPDFDFGEVYLTFVIASDGKLKDLKIIEHKTHANDYLKEIGLRSIKESSPFPPFPKDLVYPELTFNVIISFELNN